MKNKIEARVEFKMEIESNPIELLKAIKEHALNYQEHKYDMSIINDALKTLINTKQKENESLQEYTKRFKVAQDVLQSHIGGPIILTKVVQGMDEYTASTTDPNKLTELNKSAFSRYLAYLYLENSDQTKYGSLLIGLNTQQSLGNNQYPKTITEANNVLSNHKFDSTTTAKKFEKTDKEKDRVLIEKPKDEELVLSFSPIEGKCYCCGKGGHRLPQCKLKNRPKEEWAINKAQENEKQSHAQASQASSSANSGNSARREENKEDVTNTESWSGAHIQFYQAEQMREMILLDNQSTTTIFCNPDFIKDVVDSDTPMYLSTNGGILTTKKKATVPGWGKVWYNPSAITNVFSYAEMAQRYPITYDSTKEDAFIVHKDGKEVKFKRMPNGLYAFTPPRVCRSAHQQSHVTTVEENKTFYTPKQFEKAKQARDFYHAMGTPTVKDLKALIRMNTVKNTPIKQTNKRKD
jgi:hypothetical protein